MNVQVAIPSYRRSDILANYTYPLITDHGIKPEDITIFVDDERDAQLYGNLFPRKNIIVTGTKGVGNCHNFIQIHYPRGTNVMFLDDDIKKVVKLVDEKTVEPVDNLQELFERGFTICRTAHTALWGISPTTNPFFMRKEVSTNLKFIWASFSGIIIDKDPKMLITMENGDCGDYEKTIKFYLKYGKVVRLNNYGLEADYQHLPGGMHDYRSPEVRWRSAQILLHRYPELISIKKKTTSKVVEFTLRDKRK